ncbi:PREDICTED: uncharacterized protein LOC107341100 [Acropora digitifera]|uniref:uncharacterized protein LOC107341100 n=1 Tax=Acropora digitifera TaxID=70779 RepID=UPI00077A3EE6|nr:PREDICTED: uncharacterized protein LOC107341100 [Acropora digitifera]
MKHVIATIKVVDFDLCELQCYRQPNCVSINFNVIPDSEGLHECELNNATHRSHDSELMSRDDYVYKGAESACDRAACENGGTCQSGFTDKGYQCVCPQASPLLIVKKSSNVTPPGRPVGATGLLLASIVQIMDSVVW